MTFSEDDLKVRASIDRIMRDRIDDLTEATLDDGQEDWQIIEWFVLTAFRVLEGIEDERLRLLYSQHLEQLARHVPRKILDRVVSTRLAEEATAWNATSPRKEES
jgi:hypothetical protein